MGSDKQRDVLEGALRVFARDGYARANIQSLATEAKVSTRTIYNKYGSKGGLFRAVVVYSATRVADRQIALSQRIFEQQADIRSILIDFGTSWSATDPETKVHFSMVRQILADIEHIDADAITAWRTAGPERVRAAIADHLATLTALNIGNAESAALQLIALTAGVVSEFPPGDHRNRAIESGVDVFLAAYEA